LYVGEAGNNGDVQIFKILDNQLSRVQVLKGHKKGVKWIKSEKVVISCGDDQGLIVWDMYLPKMLSANIVKNTSINGIAIICSNESETKFVTYGTYCHFKVWTVDLKSPGKKVQGQAVPKLVGQKVKISNDP
jgi:hypothetical protein